MRLFVAVNFDEIVLDAIEASIGAFPIKRPPWRWGERGSWHVTLKFLGEVPPESVDVVAAALAGVAKRHAPFAVEIGAFDAFPNLNRPRVLYFDVRDEAGQLGVLASDVNAVLAERAGIRAETKPFKAHATVARVKTRIGRPAVDALKRVTALDGVGQAVGRFDLMESHLGPKGSRYTVVKPFALGNVP